MDDNVSAISVDSDCRRETAFEEKEDVEDPTGMLGWQVDGSTGGINSSDTQGENDLYNGKQAAAQARITEGS